MRLSLVIPVHNGAATIASCLDAAFTSLPEGCEVVVVDDRSTDGSAAVIRRYPCRLVRLGRRSGAARARNIGACHSSGDLLFFIDADCLVQPDTLAKVRSALEHHGPGAVVGGTYTPEPGDRDFFSRFQSVFIHHAETRRPHDPDYVASHAMALHRSTFLQNNGFPEDFLPIIEDVEFSHRLRRNGCRLVMHPGIQVRHVFRFSLRRSLRNAVRKTRYWTRYSLQNRDLLADSGTASRGLKVNVATWAASLAAACTATALAMPWPLAVIPVLLGANSIVNQGLFRAWRETGGPVFGILAAAYYLLVYPAAVAAGGLLGLTEHIAGRDRDNVHVPEHGQS